MIIVIFGMEFVEFMKSVFVVINNSLDSVLCENVVGVKVKDSDIFSLLVFVEDDFFY